MNFHMSFIARDRSAALNRIVAAREVGPDRFPPSVLDFLEAAVREMTHAGMVQVSAQGTFWSERGGAGYQSSNANIVVQAMAGTDFVEGPER